MTIHLSEIIVILIVALVVIKPADLPALALKLGRSVQWLRQHILKLKREFEPHD
jgi:Sec-independent protein translocase protein TatA